MFSLQYTCKRLLAILLPVSFLWTFAACVLICTAHASEAQREHESRSLSEAEFLADTECCPFRTSQLSVLPERRPAISKVCIDQSICCVPVTQVTMYSLQPYKQNGCLPSFSDPPLERLCTLRI